MTGGALLAAACLAIAAGGVLGCTPEPVTYTYIEVAVTLDPMTVTDENRRKIDVCHVTPSHGSTFSIPCPRDRVQYAYGTFEYATTLTKGDFHFRVAMKNVRTLLAEGMSDTVTIVPGQTLAAKVTVKGLPGDGGTDGGDGAAD